MHITIVTLGTTGDIRPYVPLALGLEKSGHNVRIAALAYDDTAGEFVRSFGIEFVPMDWELVDIHEYYLKKRIFNIRTLNEIAWISEELKNKNGMLTQLWQVCQGTDAIMFNTTVFPCIYIAEKLGIPYYLVPVQAHHQTRAFYYSHMPYFKHLGSIYNWLSYPLFDQILWLYIRQTINQWRRESLNLPPLPFFVGVLRYIQQRKIPALYGYSPSFLPKPSDWEEHVHVTGYCFLDNPGNWQPPTNLINFLSEGSPPIYISRLWNADRFTKEVLLEVSALTGQRIIVQSSNDDDLDDTEFTDKILSIKGSVYHNWLFPKMSVVVHQAGLGTIMTSLRVGVPMIVVVDDGNIFLNDHEFWAAHLAQSGLGINYTIPRQEQLSVQRLAAAINTAINDKAMNARVVEISHKIQAEDSVKRAIEAFHQHLPSNSLESKFSTDVLA